MSLSRKFKQAFVRYYNPSSKGLLVPTALLAAGFAGYGVGTHVDNAPATEPLAPMTQQARAEETAILKKDLALIGQLNKQYQTFDAQKKQAEEELQKPDLLKQSDIQKVRANIEKLAEEKLEARFSLDDQTENFLDFALLKSHLPEATIAATVDSYAKQWDLPADVKIGYNYRDEVRASFDPSGLSTFGAVHKIRDEVAKESHDRESMTNFATLIGAGGGGLSSLLLFGLGGSLLRGKFSESLNREEQEEKNRRRKAAATENEKRKTQETPPVPEQPAMPVTPAPAPVATDKPAGGLRL